jgi:hypothetical protein
MNIPPFRQFLLFAGGTPNAIYFSDFPPWKGGQTIARGERSEPLVIGSE